MKKRVLGLICFCVGCGMLMVIIIPALGWILTSAAVFILVGWLLVCGDD
ncbi:MAG: hypothetical protein ACLSH8_10145 [Zhenhengia sp.]|uniref:Uncharacterized protein n=1 Tax=Zhenhengia yiwuensis TaxID=2763666 RepID=A0A926EI44_9FIRM|nr:hypothetical protein [Zhenhengia yiwuensis]MBP3911119.1 hypothetical protein [Niameybacter sp.]MBS5315787.1 hypothetical protein [Clostridiales bacterium]MBC8579415.1 hypothetical protein [Zhenhengia yiwuensis]MBS5798315.1 hypothetical protein [Clostridiales bacterium]MDU6360379.1 hypothetical protein [Clostridiales bacterium]